MPFDINFDEGYSLCRYFNENEKRWYTTEKKVKLGALQIDFHNYENEIQLQRIKKSPYSGLSFDIDITYVQSRIRDTEYERDPIVRLLVISNRSMGEIFDTRIILPNDNPVDITFEAIFSIIEKVGRPTNIHYKSDICEAILTDFCNKTNINLTKEDSLPNIHNFILSITMD